MHIFFSQLKCHTYVGVFIVFELRLILTSGMSCIFFTENLDLTLCFMAQGQLRCGGELVGLADKTSARIQCLTIKKSSL